MIGTERIGLILDAATRLAERHGYLKIKQREVAQSAGCAKGLVTHYFKSMDGLRDELMRHAIEENNLTIIAQGLANNHPRARRVPPRVRNAASGKLANAG